MTDAYLLAASLLTTGQISVPPPPPLPMNQLDSISALLAATAAQTLQSIAAPQMVPTLERTSPEFSQLQPILAELPTQTTSVLTAGADSVAIELVSNQENLPKPQSTDTRPTSGSQLFIQRLAALKAGKLYTRLPADSFQSLWQKGYLIERLLQTPPTHEQWKYLLQQEAIAVAQGQGSNRLGILVGDSLSMWFPSEQFPLGLLWLNQGISGENSSQILNRLSAFAQTRPDTIYVMAGINDLRQGASDRVILDNLRQIMRRLRLNHPQSQIIVQSILPTRTREIPIERIRNLNQQIASIALQEEVGYLNLYTLFADEQGQMRPDLTTDGIHLTRRGYEVWQQALNYTQSAIAAHQGTRFAP